MKQLILSLAVIGAIMAVGTAEAQKKSPPKKLYRWVDKDGKVQFSDSLPPEAIEAAIASQRTSLTGLLLLAAEAELAGRPVKPAQAQTIVQLHREIGKQQQMLIVKQAELIDADRQLEFLVQRFRALKAQGSDDAAPADTGAAPPAGDVPAEAG